MKEGYTNVHALVGGLYAYKDAGGEVVQAPATPAPAATEAPVVKPVEAKAPEGKAGDAKPVVKGKH
jgi:3-mercaptopyruvate sulfurtransferase SseA